MEWSRGLTAAFRRLARTANFEKKIKFINSAANGLNAGRRTGTEAGEAADARHGLGRAINNLALLMPEPCLFSEKHGASQKKRFWRGVFK